MTLKTLFLCNNLDVGGLETYLLRLSRWLSKEGRSHEIHLLCKSGRFGTYEPDFRQIGAVLHEIPLGYLDLFGHLRFYQFLKKNRFDVICDFGGDFAGLTLLAAKFAQIPARISFYRSSRNAYSPSATKNFYQLILNRLVYAFGTRILSNSLEAFGYFYSWKKGKLDDRFHVISNGIPLPPALGSKGRDQVRMDVGIASDEKAILHVGSGRWEKNHQCILDIAKLAENEGLKVVFLLVGPGVEDAVMDRLRELGLGNIRFLGVRRDVDRLLQAADLFLFPSLTEGQPNAFLEALVAGVPFVASDIAPIREVLSPAWGNRWLFPPNAPEAGFALLKHHLRMGTGSDTEFGELVEWARRTFSEDKQFKKFCETLI